MRTTLAIDDDVFHAAKALASNQGKSLGAVISELARQGITSGFRTEESPAGFRMLPRRGVVITPEFVNELRDDEE